MTLSRVREPRCLSLLLGILTAVSFWYLQWWHWGPKVLRHPLWPLLGILVLALLFRGQLWPRRWGDGLLLGVGVTLAIGVVWTGRWHGSGLREPLALLQGVGIAYIVARATSGYTTARWIYRITLWFTGVLVLVAVAQFLLYWSTGYFFTFQTGQFAGVSPSRWTPCCGLFAVSSVYGDPRDFSVRLAGLWSLAWFGWLFAPEQGGYRKVAGFLVILGAALILLNFTRAAVLALGVSGVAGGILALYRRRLAYGRLALLGAALGFLIVWMSPLLDRVLEIEARSPAFRLGLWHQYLRHLGLWGAKVPFPETLSLHSLWLAFLFYGGFPTLGLWLLLVGYLGTGLLRFEESEGFRWFLVFFGGTLGYWVAYGLFSGYGFPHHWITLGVTVALRGRLRAKIRWR